MIRVVERIVERFMLEVLAVLKSSPTSMATLLGFVAIFWDGGVRQVEAYFFFPTSFHRL